MLQILWRYNAYWVTYKTSTTGMLRNGSLSGTQVLQTLPVSIKVVQNEDQ
jgi:hypothetical protein